MADKCGGKGSDFESTEEYSKCLPIIPVTFHQICGFLPSSFYKLLIFDF